MALKNFIDNIPGRWAAAMVAALLLLWLGAGGAVGLVLDEEDHKGFLNVRKGFRFSDVSVEGNETMFLASRSQFGSTPLNLGGSFAQTLRVDVDMEVLPRLSVRGKFDDTQTADKQQLAVEYRSDELQFVGGDIQSGFAGTEFPMESQQLFGARGKYSFDGSAVYGLVAHISTSSGHYEANGDGTGGPYFMADHKLTENSERVYVDGVRKLRGSDYSIDYLTGVINFTAPVDARFKITVDYEFIPVIATAGTNVFASRVASDLTTAANVGVTVGTRKGGTDPSRDLFGVDGRMNLPGGTSIGGEIAVAKEGETVGEAFKGELAGGLGKGSWNAALRAVMPDFTGLSSVTSRKDQADMNLGLTYPWDRDLKLSSRLTLSRDNLKHDPTRPVVHDYIDENSAVWNLPTASRVELTFANRNEFHVDDLAVHALDTLATSFSIASRYRLDKHMLHASYELRGTDDMSGTGRPRRSLTHVANTQLQSQLFGQAFTTETLQYTRQEDAATGAVQSQQILAGVDFNAPIMKFLGTNASYTLQHQTGEGAADTHSATMTLRAAGIKNLSAESTLQLKRNIPTTGPANENAIWSGRLGYAVGTHATLSADLQRQIAATSSTVSPSSLDLKGSYRPSKDWDLGGGYRLDNQDDLTGKGNSYTARTGYTEINVIF